MSKFESMDVIENKKVGENRSERDKKTEVDTKYTSSVLKYFTERKKDWLKGFEEPDEEDKRYANFLENTGRELSKIGSSKQLEKMKPSDISLATSELAGFIVSNREIDPNSTQSESDQEKRYMESKRIFMETCKKMFPEVQKGSGLSVLYNEPEILNKQGIPAVGINLTRATELYRNDPKKLIEEIDAILKMSGNAMKGLAYDTFLAENPINPEDEDSNPDELRERLGVATESFYKIELIRDELITKVYGRPDIRPSEIDEINRLKNYKK